jgi:hypothetical protein
MHAIFSRSIRSLCLALVTLQFVACTSVPISSLYSLSKLDPMKTDPEQIRVAIRVNESVNATLSNTQITTGYKADDGSIDEEHQFVVQLNSAQTLTPKLTRGLLSGERVTVMSLSPQDAQIMRDFQQRLASYLADGGDGDGSFSLRMRELCLDKPLPDGKIPLTLFLKTENQDDYIVFVKTELHDAFSDNDSNVDDLPFCEERPVEDV